MIPPSLVFPHTKSIEGAAILAIENSQYCAQVLLSERGFATNGKRPAHGKPKYRYAENTREHCRLPWRRIAAAAVSKAAAALEQHSGPRFARMLILNTSDGAGTANSRYGHDRARHYAEPGRRPAAASPAGKIVGRNGLRPWPGAMRGKRGIASREYLA
jgi:hypothetical protein